MVYIPPKGSPFENKDVFTELDNSLLLLEHDGVCFGGILMLGLVMWTALSQMDLITILTCRIKFLMIPPPPLPGSDKIPSALPKRISQDMATNSYGFRSLDFCKTVDIASQWACWIRRQYWEMYM